MKKIVLSSFLIFIVWSLFDFFVHGLLFQDFYEKTSSLWRPMKEIQSFWWVHIITFTCAFLFSWLYCCHTSNEHKSIYKGVSFGAKIGAIFGLIMGYGLYAIMPIPLSMAHAWFISTFLAFAVGGILAASVIKDCQCPRMHK